ncbi:MAG: maltotransferase domain-containing protein, partial [Pseudomonas sp.]|uniref:maltotransferase domain-containing protein n=1 Tax=Pseudomonas sp. TaxID=306 RepID=UPI0030F02C00
MSHARPLAPLNQVAERQAASLQLDDALQLPRIAIESVTPVVEAGRFPAKSIVGSPITVSAVIFTDGHDKLDGAVLYRAELEEIWHRVPLKDLGNDLWQAEFSVQEPGRYQFAVQAWWDGYATFTYELMKKFGAGVPITLELQEGEQLMRRAAENAAPEHAEQMAERLRTLQDTQSVEERVAFFLDPHSTELMRLTEPHPHRINSPAYPIDVERKRAEFASWYELFPRSVTDDPARHGTLRDVISRLPYVRDMGFDVLYFPPIHPIGRAHRKGRNNSLKAGVDDPGSPYAIGSEDGGHDAIHPQLGTFEDFRALVKAAKEHGLEIALDFAI